MIELFNINGYLVRRVREIDFEGVDSKLNIGL